MSETAKLLRDLLRKEEGIIPIYHLSEYTAPWWECGACKGYNTVSVCHIFCPNCGTRIKR